MWTTLFTAWIAIGALLVGWVAVQQAWRRVFPDGTDPDALAGRMGCHGGCKPEDCARRCPERAGAAEEDRT